MSNLKTVVFYRTNHIKNKKIIKNHLNKSVFLVMKGPLLRCDLQYSRIRTGR